MRWQALLAIVLVLLACCVPPPRTPGPSVVAVAPASARDGKLAPRARPPADGNGVRLVAQLQHTENIDSISYSPDGTLALTTGTSPSRSGTRPRSRSSAP